MSRAAGWHYALVVLGFGFGFCCFLAPLPPRTCFTAPFYLSVLWTGTCCEGLAIRPPRSRLHRLINDFTLGDFQPFPGPILPHPILTGNAKGKGRGWEWKRDENALNQPAGNFGRDPQTKK